MYAAVALSSMMTSWQNRQCFSDSPYPFDGAGLAAFGTFGAFAARSSRSPGVAAWSRLAAAMNSHQQDSKRLAIASLATEKSENCLHLTPGVGRNVRPVASTGIYRFKLSGTRRMLPFAANFTVCP
jgi:hypothetical protein